MPARENSLPRDGCGLGGDQSYHQRRHREAMASNTSPHGPEGSKSRVVQPSPLDDADWDHDQDEAAGHRARRLLARSSPGYHRFGDRLRAVGRWLASERWVMRLAIVTGAYHERGTSNRKPYEYHDRLTDVWVKNGNTWEVIASHYSVPTK